MEEVSIAMLVYPKVNHSNLGFKERQVPDEKTVAHRIQSGQSKQCFGRRFVFSKCFIGTVGFVLQSAALYNGFS